MASIIKEQEIQQCVEKIIHEFKPEKIILFGSWAWGQPHKDSDVDLFIVKKSDKNQLEMMAEVDYLLFGRTIPMDILVYTPQQTERRMRLGDPFVKKILTDGKILYDAAGTGQGISR